LNFSSVLANFDEPSWLAGMADAERLLLDMIIWDLL